MEYPKKIKLKDDKMLKLLTEKSELILAGRAKSEEIEKIEKEMEDIDKSIQVEEKKVDISDLIQKEKEISDRVQVCINEMNELKEEIFKRMKEQVDGELHIKYENLVKEKEKLEKERNKIAIKAQKFNDKIIPLGRKLMKPFLEDKYDDYETIQVEDGEIVATIFNHLDEFKINFDKK